MFVFVYYLITKSQPEDLLRILYSKIHPSDRLYLILPFSCFHHYMKIFSISTSTTPTAHATVDVTDQIVNWSFASLTPRVLFTTQK